MMDIKPSSKTRRTAHSGRQHSIVTLLCTLALLTAGAVWAQPSALPPTAPAQRSAATLSRAVAEYGRTLDKLAASGKVTGLATAIVAGDKVVFERSIGVTEVATGEPVTSTTVFRVASLSKGFTSTLAGLLVREGKLRWNTRIADVLTYFQMRNDSATRHMTLQDILSHRTGLPHNTFDRRLERDVPYRELVRELDRVRLTCPVGECYGYQNVAFSMFGDMVYPLTGDFFDHQMAKRLFQPLGMDTASYGRTALEASASWARPHVRQQGGYVAVVPKPNYYWVSPAAGVNASIRDLEKWLSAQMGYAPDVLSPALLETLHAPRVDTPGQTRYSSWRRARLRGAHYALGWRVYDYAGHTLVYHAGAVEGYRAIIGFLPEYGVGMVAVWNCSCATPGNLMPMFLDSFLQLQRRDWIGLGR